MSECVSVCACVCVCVHVSAVEIHSGHVGRQRFWEVRKTSQSRRKQDTNGEATPSLANSHISCFLVAQKVLVTNTRIQWEQG